MINSKRNIYIFILLTAILVSFYLSPKLIFEKVSSNILGTKVTTEKVNIQPFKGIFQLNNVKISNLKHLHEPSVFTAKEITLKIDLKSFFSNVIRLENIEIKSGKITYELDPNISLMSNLELIQRNISKYTPKNNSQKFIINRLLIKNCSFTYNQSEPSSHIITIPNVKMVNIGSEVNGIYPEQIGWEVIVYIIMHKAFSIKDYL